jgi:hypothetical protein
VAAGAPDIWPPLPLADWQDTYATLHRWTQIVGKLRLAHAPMLNHWWQVPLYVTSRGLTTSLIPYGSRSFQVDFDFIDHRLRIAASDGATSGFDLEPRSVAAFYQQVMQRLAALGLETHIWTMPVEIENPVPFETDTAHAAYDPDAAQRFWRILLQSDRLLAEFRARFIGKASPVHFFWGSFDLAVTRFSGRAAPPHPGAPNISDRITREAYSHEVSSAGFWPGGGPIAYPAYYSYAYPAPPGFGDAKLRPGAAFYAKELGEFLLPYDAVRNAADPDAMLRDFLQSTYEAAADLGKWDRAALERR